MSVSGLIGVVHLRPMPGDPAHRGGGFEDVLEAAARDAEALVEGGADAMIVENFGSAPFPKGTPEQPTPPHQIAMIARAVAACRRLGKPVGVNVLRKRIPRLLEDGGNGLSDFFRELLSRGYQQLTELDEHIDAYTRSLDTLARQDDACQRLQTIPGYGPVIASAFYSAVGNGSAYRRGRDVSASLGIVPRQHSSGGKEVLLGISKRGDRYLRSLLIHGARAVVSRAANKEDALSRWINKVRAARGFNRAVVALANKLARIGWAILARNTVYQAA